MARRKPAVVPPTLRFAHPFYTTIAPEARAASPYGRRMLDHIASRLQPIPRARGRSVMTLADIVGRPGAAAIEQSGQLSFHAVGDTGRRKDSPQGSVADAMAQEFDIAHPERCPAFFLHLGDVIYGPGKDEAFRREFYEPYDHYPGKIIAIPGNHDGEVFPRSDRTSLRAFRANFCATAPAVPTIAGTIFRQTMTQPGVYWMLDAPFVQIIGLYSNVAENPGFISGRIPGPHQKAWLVDALRRIKAGRAHEGRRALILATHHPPYTSGGHSPSHAMLADIDEACARAGLSPDLFIAGHSHNYQRYTRFVNADGTRLEVPFLVAGTGGINDSAVPKATGQRTDDHVFVASHKGYGFVRLTVDAQAIRGAFISVDESRTTTVDQFSLDLASGRVT